MCPCSGRAGSAIGGRSRSGRGHGDGRGGRGGRRRDVAWVRDAPLSAVLVLPVLVIDQLETVASVAWCEVGGWCPGVGAAVLDLLDDGVLGNVVAAWALEEDDGDGAGGRWLPGLRCALVIRLLSFGLCWMRLRW